MELTRQEKIRRALEDLEVIRLCESIVNEESIHEEVVEVFAEAQYKRGYVPGFYRIQNEYNGYSNEEEL
jgi:hypothetical protein